jgi:dienelactone hydrolase
MLRRRWLIPAILFVLVIVVFAWRHSSATGFVVRAAGIQGLVARTLAWTAAPVAERPVDVPWSGGTLRARAYVPGGGSNDAVLLVPGVHASGIDEPRLAKFAADLAATGRTVVAVELPPLTRYRITPELTDMIEEAAMWLADQPDLAGNRRIGIAGISFAGGLSIVASARERIRNRVAFVFSFGGHGDLPRTLRYLCTGIQPDGSYFSPHDYGVAIVLLGLAEQVVPPEQAAPLRAAIETFLEGSRLDMVDQTLAAREFARARDLAAQLPEPAASLMRAVNDRDVGTLGPILLPHVTAYAGDPALSPASSPAPAAPVYLLHGSGDNVIPAMESTLLADELARRGADVRQLSTPLITHAEVNNAAAALEIWRLIRFCRALLAER